MSGKKGMIRYSEELKEQIRKKFRQDKVKEKSVANMESAVIRYRVGVVSDRRQNYGRRCLYAKADREK